MDQATSGASVPSRGHRQATGAWRAAQTARIRGEIIALGANFYDLLLPETRVLPSFVHADERIEGLVYGRYVWQDGSASPPSGRGVLVATDKRVMLIDKKLLFVRCDEIGYDSVSGVAYSRTWFTEVVTLHTRAGDIQVRSLNGACASSFVASIEGRVIAASV